jgi:hypothetical protein
LGAFGLSTLLLGLDGRLLLIPHFFSPHWFLIPAASAALTSSGDITRARGIDTEIVKNHAAFIWSVADLLPGNYKQSEYGRVILPLGPWPRCGTLL